MKSTAAIFASILSSAAATPTKTPDLVMTNFAGTTCAGAPLAYAVVSNTCDAQSPTTSRKFVAGTTAGAFAMNGYPDATCTGTAVPVAMAADGTTCATTSATGTGTSAKLMPFASATTASSDLAFGFYSDDKCDVPVQATATGNFAYMNSATGACIKDTPAAGSSIQISYTSTMMDVSIWANTAGDCGVAGSVTTANKIDGVPGECKKLEGAGLATAKVFPSTAAGSCPATGDCYIYVFPAGAVAPAMSGASSASLAAVTAAGAVAAAVLLA